MKKGKVISFWMDEDEISMLKKRSKKENRSVSNYVKTKLFKLDNE